MLPVVTEDQFHGRTRSPRARNERRVILSPRQERRQPRRQVIVSPRQEKPALYPLQREYQEDYPESLSISMPEEQRPLQKVYVIADPVDEEQRPLQKVYVYDDPVDKVYVIDDPVDDRRVYRRPNQKAEQDSGDQVSAALVMLALAILIAGIIVFMYGMDVF